jgi:hypothetical protein
VGGLHTGKEAGPGNHVLLLLLAKVVKLVAGEGQALSVLVLLEDTNALADGYGRFLVVPSDNDDADPCRLALDDGVLHLHPRRVKHSDHTDEGH